MNRQDSQASSFSRPAYGSQHSQQRSFSRPILPAQPSQTTYAQFAPPSEKPRHIATGDSYEMTRQAPYTISPTEIAGAGSYVAFNPAMLSASSTPIPQPPSAYPLPGPPPRRNITVTGEPGAAHNYFGAVRKVPQRSATAPIDPRHTTGYGDIISDYRDSARNFISPPVFAGVDAQRHVSSVYSVLPDDRSLRRPSLPMEPVPSLARQYTASPTAMGTHMAAYPYASSVGSAESGLRSPAYPEPPAAPPALTRAHTDSWEASGANRF